MNLVEIPLKAVPKARPRVVHAGHVYMPAHYMAWREAFVANLQAQRITHAKPLLGSMKLWVRVSGDTIGVNLTPTEAVRPTGVRGDLDNLVGAIMDALQDAGVYLNDAQVVSIDAAFADATDVASTDD